MNENTRDLSKFGYRELAIAGDLLTAYAQEGKGSDFLGDGVAVEFNPNSGSVFLVDEDFNVGVLEDGNIVEFFHCVECSVEGTKAEIQAENDGIHTFDSENLPGRLDHIEETK